MSEHTYKLKEAFGSDYETFKDDDMFKKIASAIDMGMSPYTAIVHILRNEKMITREYQKLKEQLERAKIIIGSEVF